MTQAITLVRSTPNFGGSRLWFLCPFTGKRVRVLYLPPGAQRWGGRRAYKLTYQSQRESGQGRALLRLLLRHGGWPGDPAAALAALHDPDPFGFREEARWERREEARERRNHLRRIARRQRVRRA